MQLEETKGNGVFLRDCNQLQTGAPREAERIDENRTWARMSRYRALAGKCSGDKVQEYTKGH